MNSNSKQTASSQDENGMENPYTGEWLPNVCGRPGAEADAASASPRGSAQAGPDAEALVATMKAWSEAVRAS